MRCLPGIFNPQAHNRGNHSGSEMTSCPGKTIGWNPHGKWEEAIRSKQDQIIPVHVELSWNSLRPQHQTYPDLVVLFLWQEQFFWLRGPICSQGAWSACRTGTKHEIWLMNVWYLVSLFLEIIFESFQKKSKRSTFGNLSKGQRSSQDECLDQYSYTSALDKRIHDGSFRFFCPPKKAIRSCSIWHLKADL